MTTFDMLPAAVANESVRAVEDAVDDNHDSSRPDCLTGNQGPAVITRLLELGWRPPVTP